MRILLTNTGPWGTGSGTVADAVMQELIKRGHEVKALFPDLGLPGNGYDKYYGRQDLYNIVPFPAMHKGVELYTFPLIIPDPNPRNYECAWTFKNMTDIEFHAYLSYMKKHLVNVLHDFRPDVIECQHIWALDHVVNQLGYKFACVAHHSDQLGFIYDKRIHTYARKSAADASYIFAISDFVREEVLDLYNVQPEKVILLENGYDQSVFRPFPLDRKQVLADFDLQHKADLPVITFCGKISRTKGVDVLLRANEIVQSKRKALLLLLGGGTLCSEDLKSLTPGCMENAVFLGHRSPQDLARLHNIAHFSVLPSRSEGFGIAALEAMGCAKPLVATRVGGLADFAVGELIEPEDPLTLAEAILRILDLPCGQYQALCQEAFATAKKYSWSSIVDRRMIYYEEIAKQNAQKDGCGVKKSVSYSVFNHTYDTSVDF